ncbi:hypothetical protein HPB47_024785 [Ixodes persulcatus]|uniref:Uncharacterized protein n=1 Tax=Ixodes persulcatus TaxID=34615 RepID=A0AC60Q3A3_IXOPE|nr:hypothetical protein HPB47_024785 [Ixodes persulcatus]
MAKVNLKELPMKGHYFFYYSALSGFLPFIGVLLKDRGVSPAEVGLVYTVAPFFSAASKPIFGALVDRSRKIKAVLLAFLICITASFAVINFLPAQCSVDDTASTFGSAIKSFIFWLYFIFVTVNYAAIGCANSLTDAACFELLVSEGEDAKDRFGRQRLWGTVGWGIFTAASGYLIDFCNEGREDGPPLMVADVACVYACDVKKHQSSTAIAKDVSKLVLRDGRVAVLLLDATMGGVLVGIVWQYHFWYLEQLGASSGLMGASVAVRSFGELPVFFYAGWLIARTGHVFVLRAALLAMAATFGLYSVIVDPWVTLGVEVLLGLALGAFFSALPSYAEKIAPPGAEATTMGLVTGFFEGFGTALGGMIGGAGFQWFGARRTFQVVAASGLVWCLLAYLAGRPPPARRLSPTRQAASVALEHAPPVILRTTGARAARAWAAASSDAGEKASYSYSSVRASELASCPS